MRSLCVLALLGLATLSSPSALAQAEYFLNGEAGGGGRVSLLNGDGQRGFGWEAGIMGSPRFGVTLGYASSDFERPGGSFGDEESYEVSALSVGVRMYPARQGLDGPLTMGLGFGVGRSRPERVTTFSVGAQVARALGRSESSLFFVPNAEVALVLAFSEAAASSTPTIGVGFGAGLAVAPALVLTLEPSAAFVFGEGDLDVLFLGSFGFAFTM